LQENISDLFSFGDLLQNPPLPFQYNAQVWIHADFAGVGKKIKLCITYLNILNGEL